MIVFWLILFFVIRSFPFRFSSIPLWYDPWLYKSMFLAYLNLWTIRDFSALPPRIQSMYEPLLGMIGSSWLMITWWWTESILTWGFVFISFLPILGICLLARRRWTLSWYFAFFLAVFSFTQYEVFWRHYRKQLVAMFFLTIVVWWWERRKWREMMPLVTGVFLVHRPAAVFILCVGVLRGGYLFFRREYKQVIHLWWSILLALLLALPIILPFLQTLFTPLIWFFWREIDIPTLQDGFQQWWTFLTIHEYLLIWWLTLLWACWWVRKKIKPTVDGPILVLAFLFFFVRVFGQWFFFQRMIGYLDMFVLVFAGGACSILWKGQWWKKIVVISICMMQMSMMLYRTYRTYRPLIEKDEFAFLSQIGKTMPSNALVIVPGIDYSPRVQWRTQSDVLAPGLFDLNRRGLLDEAWNSKWVSRSAQEKCIWFQRDYPDLLDRPVYLWVWSKQQKTELKGACFDLLQQGKWWSRRKMNKL